jgi:hypothetical protein
MLSQLTLYKKVANDIIHYVATKNNNVIASIELNSTKSGHCWVRHSVSDVSHQGLGTKMYKLAISDLFPFGIMPSREVTSGHACALWDKLWADQSITKKQITDTGTYFHEADEWIEELLKVNPSHTEESLEALESDYSYFDAVQRGDLTAHPYNHAYIAPNTSNHSIIIATAKEDGFFKQAEELFYAKYEKLDL